MTGAVNAYHSSDRSRLRIPVIGERLYMDAPGLPSIQLLMA
jgi:hypothetical protein